MTTHVLFLLYIFAGFLALAGAGLAVLLIRHKDAGRQGLFTSARNFIFCSLFIGILYFASFYRSLILNQWNWNFLMRGLDIVLFIALTYFWIEFIMEITKPNRLVVERVKRITDAIFLCFAVVSFINYAFLTDGYYFIESGPLRIYVIAAEVTVGTGLTAATVFYAGAGFKSAARKGDRLFLALVSLFLSVNGIWNCINVIGLFTGFYSSEREPLGFDPTSVMLVLINLCSLVYVYKHDFSPIYFMSVEKVQAESIVQSAQEAQAESIVREVQEAQAFPAVQTAGRPSSDDEAKEAIARICQSHRLTEREREVLIYAYGGYTNPDIAQALFISKNTVRNHMHSIFAKLEVSTRIDMIHLINHGKDQS